MSEILDDAIEFLSMVSTDKYVHILFLKKNGEKRLMKATLNFKNIPMEYHPKGYNLKNILQKMRKSNILSVFDLEKMGWRSIKLDNIIEVTTSKNKVFSYKIDIVNFHRIQL